MFDSGIGTSRPETFNNWDLLDIECSIWLTYWSINEAYPRAVIGETKQVIYDKTFYL